MDDSIESEAKEPAPNWLLLIHRLPPKPDYVRVKVRRRLQRLGAAPLKNSVYVLPASDAALEDFHWLAREIRDAGGEALICRAAFLEGITDTELQAMFETGGSDPAHSGGATHAEQVQPGRTWVTRRDVHVDRMASAWLIRRFIDAQARFKFVAPAGYRPRTGELRFDMYEAEYTHEGELCTFQVLLRRFGLSDPALAAIGEIIRDIDCKDVKYGRPETAGIAALIGGIAEAVPDDTERLARSATVFEGLLQHFGSRA